MNNLIGKENIMIFRTAAASSISIDY